MYGWEKITGMCGLGCKVFWHPWTQDEKLPYDAVNKDDNDVTDCQDPITSEPQKPIWTDMKNLTPIVKNKSASVGNIRNTSGYEKVSSNGYIVQSTGRANEKRNSTASLNTSAFSSKALLNETKEISGSRASLADEKLHVQELVTTV